MDTGPGPGKDTVGQVGIHPRGGAQVGIQGVGGLPGLDTQATTSRGLGRAIQGKDLPTTTPKVGLDTPPASLAME